MLLLRRLLAPSAASLYLVFLSSTGTAQTFVASNTLGHEPDWYPHVLARGDDREIIENTPIEFRPYRPMHFYGNTIRRGYYRGSSIARPVDWANTARYLIRRR